MPLFSVIIPVYKVEDYLLKCVNSVLKQDFKDFEVILVNDGSPDNCPAICDQLASDDHRIVVIHKKNGGSSDARNVGMKAAKGDFLLFLDSDDYWEGPDALGNLASTIKEHNADLTLYGTKDVNLSMNTTFLSRGNYNITALRRDKDAAIKSLFETQQFPGSAWVLAVKRVFILQNDLFFITGIKAEDIDWLLKVFTHAETFDAINDAFYMYIKNRPGSITNTSDLKSALDILSTIAKWRPVLEGNLTVSNRFLLSYLAYQYITSYLIFSELKESDRKLLLPLIKNESPILRFALGRKAVMCKLIIKCLGIKQSGKVFNLVHRLNNRTALVKKIIK